MKKLHLISVFFIITIFSQIPANSSIAATINTISSSAYSTATANYYWTGNFNTANQDGDIAIGFADEGAIASASAGTYACIASADASVSRTTPGISSWLGLGTDYDLYAEYWFSVEGQTLQAYAKTDAYVRFMITSDYGIGNDGGIELRLMGGRDNVYVSDYSSHSYLGTVYSIWDLTDNSEIITLRDFDFNEAIVGSVFLHYDTEYEFVLESEGLMWLLSGPDSDIGGLYINNTLALNLTTEEEPEPVPEPATMLLFGLGILGLAGFRRKFRKK